MLVYISFMSDTLLVIVRAAWVLHAAVARLLATRLDTQFWIILQNDDIKRSTIYNTRSAVCMPRVSDVFKVRGAYETRM